MTYSLRPYRKEESDLACDVRGLVSDEARSRFKQRLETPEGWNDHYLHLAIDLDGRLIGDVQLRHCNQTMPSGVAHIGIDVGQEFRGKGAGTEALKLAWDWAKDNSFHRLEGSTDETNTAMRKAFEKADWKLEGIAKNLFLEDGQGHDFYVYAKTI